MADLRENLALNRCPHCSVAKPHCPGVHYLESLSPANNLKMFWRVYRCQACGKLITAWSPTNSGPVAGIYPRSMSISEQITGKTAEYLRQALESLHAPAASTVVSASAVDSMLKDKGLRDGSLFSRIEQARHDGLITKDMAEWAHEVRLDANEQRHADDDASLPTPEDAQKTLDFAIGLAEILYVLPSRVTRTN